MIDPRLHIVGKRLEKVKKIIAVSGSKGGIGKSTVASVLALCLARKGYEVGLLDLDLSGPSTHVILGVEGVHPKEDKGLIPPKVHGVKFMSIIYFAGDNPSPLRGHDISNIIVELLTITLWGPLDMLVLDMPPGISDSILDIIRLIKKMEFLVVTTPSRVAIGVMKKELKILEELNIPVIGVLENMRTVINSPKEMVNLRVSIIGSMPFDFSLEDAMGDVEKLLNTQFARQFDRIVENIIRR